MSAQPQHAPAVPVAPAQPLAPVIPLPDRTRLQPPDEWHPGYAGPGIGGPLADYECVHGRIPGERCPHPPHWPHAHPCGCFPWETGA